jgi:hypothetical protein
MDAKKGSITASTGNPVTGSEAGSFGLLQSF